MKSVVYSDLAQADLFDIHDWIEQKSGESRADKVTAKILDRCSALGDDSVVHTGRDDLPEGNYRIVVLSYVVVYQVTATDIRIVRIIHGARNFPDLNL